MNTLANIEISGPETSHPGQKDRPAAQFPGLVCRPLFGAVLTSASTRHILNNSRPFASIRGLSFEFSGFRSVPPFSTLPAIKPVKARLNLIKPVRE
jgi:hypothetical protein